MDKKEILTVLRELHNVTGFRVSLHGADYTEIAAYPERALPFCASIHGFTGELSKCVECDRLACKRAIESRESVIYKCRYGLTESVSPLYNFGELTGFLMMGQIAECEEDKWHAEGLAKKLLGEQVAKHAADIPTVKEGLVRSYAKIMEICARYLTLSGAVEAKKPSIGARAKKYISENYSRKILIKDICEHLGCSKSTLINTFSAEYGITVNAFITALRLDEAAKLAQATDMSIFEIASATGFSDQAYFSRVFSSRYGISPGKYKKLHGKE